MADVPRTVADDLAAALTVFMENDCARLDITVDEWHAAHRAMERYRNPLDLPPLEMTDDEWHRWCELLEIDDE